MSPTERDLLQKLYANSQESVFVLDAENLILTTNPRATRFHNRDSSR